MSELKYKLFITTNGVDVKGSEACFVYDDKIVHRQASFMQNQPETVIPMSKIQEIYYHDASFFSGPYIRLTIAGSGYHLIYNCCVNKAITQSAVDYIQERIAELARPQVITQTVQVSKPAPSSSSVISVSDELIALKKLLDSGIITQSDFDAKKKQLLGL